METLRKTQVRYVPTCNWQRVWMGTFLLILTAEIAAAEPPLPRVAGTGLQSGRQVGEKVPQFYVRAVTGPLMNRSVCYVCRNGERPVVMVLARECQPELTPLLKGIDEIVDCSRAAGVRGFGVLLAENHQNAVSQLQTLAFDSKLSIPLAVAAPHIDAPANQNVHPDAAVTVVLYVRQQVVANFAFRTGELSEPDVRKVLDNVRTFAATAGEASKLPDSAAR